MDVLVLGELVAADAVIALYRHVTHRAIVAVLNARAAPIMQQVKGDVFVFRGGVELNRDRYQPEGQ